MEDRRCAAGVVVPIYLDGGVSSDGLNVTLAAIKLAVAATLPEYVSSCLLVCT
jgi:hypothetical protein